MRLDLPQELPRSRAPEVPQPVPSLKRSPIELRRESLSAIAADRRPMPRALPNRRPARPQMPEQPAIVPGRAMDHRPRRNDIPRQTIGLSLRDEERRVLAEVGRFRVIATRDLAETIYDNRHSRMQRDLAFLRSRDLIGIDTVNGRRDGRGGRVERIEVVTLTRGGQSLVRLTGGLPQDQKLYAGLVKPREVEHDTQIYRACRKQAKRIEEKGGTNLRVKLDFELKSNVQKAICAARKAEPKRGMAEIKQQVAQQFDLPYVNDGVQIPDARIEYEIENKDENASTQGSRTGHDDVEVLTAAYHAGHLRAKAQAGFYNYASPSDRGSVTAKIADDQELMEGILDL